MNDTFVTVVGNVVDSPAKRRTSKGDVTKFRMAATSRRYDAAAGDYVDGSTLWIDVSCWNALAGNVVHSINKGDEVIVRGTLTTESWEGENGRRSATRLKALSVGASLSRGWTTFHRVQRPAQPAGEPPAGPIDDRVPDASFDEHGTGAAPAGEDYIDDPATLSSVDPGQEVREPAYG